MPEKQRTARKAYNDAIIMMELSLLKHLHVWPKIIQNKLRTARQLLFFSYSQHLK